MNKQIRHAIQDLLNTTFELNYTNPKYRFNIDYQGRFNSLHISVCKLDENNKDYKLLYTEDAYVFIDNKNILNELTKIKSRLLNVVKDENGPTINYLNNKFKAVIYFGQEIMIRCHHQYIAICANGEAFSFEEQPEINDEGEYWENGADEEDIGYFHLNGMDWRKTLQHFPN